jgi:hypothetical protein
MRIRWERATLLALLLGSCERQPETVPLSERMDRAEANLGRVAVASSQMVDRVERGEHRIDDLESRVRNLEPARETICLADAAPHDLWR